MLYKINTRRTAAQAFESPKLRHVFLKLNERCNATCSFCSCWHTKVDVCRVDMVRLVAELKALEPNEVNLSGGEPLLFHDFWGLLASGEGRVPWSITTNGSVMGTESKLQRLRSSGVRRLFISLDSDDPDEHDRSRGTPGMFARIMHALALIDEWRWPVEVIVNHVVTRHNAANVGRFVRTLWGAKARGIQLIPVKGAPDCFLSASDVDAFYRGLEAGFASGTVRREMFVSGRYEIFGRTPEELAEVEEGRYRHVGRTGCGLPSATMFVDCASGDVYPCDTTYWRADPAIYRMGNVLEESLEAIWAGSRFRAFRAAMFPTVGHACYWQCDPANVLRDGDLHDAEPRSGS